MTVRRASLLLLAGAGLFMMTCALSEPVSKINKIHKAECLDCETDEQLSRCQDGKDNDEDHLTDCEDPDCAAFKACNVVYTDDENTPELCSDGFDNDSNGFTDCGDFDCIPTDACKDPIQKPEDTNAVCSDGLDNDHDGELDCRDHDCGADGVTVCEASNATCQDGFDNDSNGHTDCSDFSCSQNPNVTVCN